MSLNLLVIMWYWKEASISILINNGKHYVICEMNQCPDRFEIVKLIQIKHWLKELHSVCSVKYAFWMYTTAVQAIWSEISVHYSTT